MSVAAYTYSVLRYVHDASVGESLNVGVVLYAPSIPYLTSRVEHRYARLSQAFMDFDGEHYRRTMHQFEGAIDHMRTTWRSGRAPLHSLPEDIGGIAAEIWPDEDLSFRFGPILAGVCHDPEETLASLFRRFVTSQAPRNQAEKRSDEQVWSVYQRPLAREAVSKVLHPKTFTTPVFELQFKHAFKNEHWHVLQPISLDYVTQEALQSKATRWLGNAMALQGHPDLGKLYLLLGPPRLSKNRQAYNRAKDLLDRMPIEHELVEEDEAEDFARELAGYARAHGVLEAP